MKKLFFLLLIATLPSLGKPKDVPTKPISKSQMNKLNSMICFGWTDIKDNITGDVIGKRSDNCWNSNFGWHSVSIYYQY